MPRRVLRPSLLIAALALAAACGGKSATGPTIRSLTGTFSGTCVSGITFTFTIVDSAQVLHGTGTAQVGAGTPIALTVVGSHDHPYFHVAFTSTGFVPATFDGNDSTTTELVGVLTGSGFTGEQLIAAKQ